MPPTMSQPAADQAPLQVEIRPTELADAEELAAVYRAEASFLAPFEPVRSPTFATVEGQRLAVREGIDGRRHDRLFPFVILVDGAVSGVVNVSNVARGVFQSATLGYFVAQRFNGRGVGSRAVGLVAEWCFGPGRLHRLEAATLVDNVGSQKVLARNGFRPYGVSRRHLKIAGDWRDHVLFARLVDDDGSPVDEVEARVAAIRAAVG